MGQLLVIFTSIKRTNVAVCDKNHTQLLRITATDKGSVIDFQVFAEQTGHELVSLSQDADEFVFVLKKR